jgi:hypothetical protein
VALEGDIALVSAPGSIDVITVPGVVYVFVRGGGGWVQQQKLQASDGVNKDFFGRTLALNGSTVLIGAPGKNANGVHDAGVVYVFALSNGVWTEQAKLIANDPTEDAGFGGALALDGNTALISADGAVYVFKRSNGVWTQQAKLLADDEVGNAYFGDAVALDGSLALIGAYGFGKPGAAYVFKRSDGTWAQQAKLTASDGEIEDFFGMGVVLVGDKTVRSRRARL